MALSPSYEAFIVAGMMQTSDLPPFHPLSCIPPTAAEQEGIQGDGEVLGEILSLSEEAFLARTSFCVGKEGKRIVTLCVLDLFGIVGFLALELSVVVLRS